MEEQIELKDLTLEQLRIMENREQVGFIRKIIQEEISKRVMKGGMTWKQ